MKKVYDVSGFENIPKIAPGPSGEPVLMVDGKPFLMVGGELHNSASSSLHFRMRHQEHHRRRPTQRPLPCSPTTLFNPPPPGKTLG